MAPRTGTRRLRRPPPPNGVTVPANGTAVWLWLLDRGERDLVATFFAVPSAQSRRRWFL